MSSAAFEQESGLTLRILQGGDANEMLNRALLTAGDPQGDVIFGIDDSVLSRALDGDLLEEYRSDELDHVAPEYADADGFVTPIDHGEVCLNVDRAWFAERGVAPPRTLDDLTEPRYRGLLVVENPATSSPGLSFLLATVARYGEDGWEALLARAPGERRPRRGRLGRGVHPAVLGCLWQPGQAADRRLVRDEPGSRGDLRLAAARGLPHRSSRGRLLPPGRVRRDPAWSCERGRRP